MITTELRAEHGRTVVVKRADPDATVDRRRLSREATMLAVARHPGVVEIADPPLDATEATGRGDDAGGGDEAGLELRTIFAGARTLAAPDLPPLAALRALAVVATTVADLHGLGLVHGRLSPDHVVLADSGRAVLCGFAEAGLAGDRRDDGEVLVPSLDVASLGELLAHHLERAAGTTRAGRGPTFDHGTISRLADRAAQADAGLRPSARSLAAALDHALPRAAPLTTTDRRADDGDVAAASTSVVPAPEVDTPRRPASPTTRPAGGGRRRRHRLVAALGVTSALALLGLGLRAVTGASGTVGSARPGSTSSATTGTSALAPASSADGGADPAGSSTSSLGSTAAPAPPPDPAVQPGGDVVIDGRPFALGTPDDRVLHARWGCGEVDTPVLVRPDGTVFRFAALAEPGRDVAGIAAGRLPPLAPVELVHDDHGCTALQALGPDGPVVLPIDPT